MGYTKDSLHAAMGSPLESGAVKGPPNNSGLESTGVTSQLTVVSKKRPPRPEKGPADSETFPSFTGSAGLDALAVIVSRQRLSWCRSSDELLVRWIDAVAYSRALHPLQLKLSHIVERRPTVLALYRAAKQDQPAGSRVKKISSQNFEEFGSTFGPLFEDFTDSEICLRALLLLHFNDLLLPLFPLLSPDDGQAAANHPSTLLRFMRGHVFDAVRGEVCGAVAREQDDFGGRSKGSAAAANAIGITTDGSRFSDGGALYLQYLIPSALSPPPAAASPPWQSLAAESFGASDSIPSSDFGDAVLEVEEEEVIAARLWSQARWAGQDHAGAGLTGSSAASGLTGGGGAAGVGGGIGTSLLLQMNPSWRLVAGFQATLAGSSTGFD